MANATRGATNATTVAVAKIASAVQDRHLAKRREGRIKTSKP
jgi:hypothetical protein